MERARRIATRRTPWSATRAAGILVVVLGLPRSFLAQCPDGSAPPCALARTTLDTARFVILPFAHTEGSQPLALDGADCAEFLTEAIQRWMEVRVADKTRIYDALARRAAHAPFRLSFDAGLAVAHQLGAGRLVMGHLWAFGDTLRVTAYLYDVAHGGMLLRQASTRMAIAGGEIGVGFNVLADSLLVAGVSAPRGLGAPQTRSLRALRAYDSGEQALRVWDLAQAMREFRVAIAADPEFARAYVELGQALLWAADSTPEADRDRALIALRANKLLNKLGRADSAQLLAQRAVFDRRWQDACRQYHDILAIDSTNFAAWYGLAECNATDPLVMPDPLDTTRYVFRGSWETAVRAYRHALLLAPSFNVAFGSRAAEHLARLLPTHVYWWREGRRDGVAYFAFPEVEGDTVAFHPLPSTRAVAIDAYLPSHVAAVGRNRRILQQLTEAWVLAFPREAQARRALAYALEAEGLIVPTSGARRSALVELRAAARLEHGAPRLSDALTLVRLLLKAGEFGAARHTADSLLRKPPHEVAGVAGVALLVGRPALAARLVAPQDSETQVPTSADHAAVALPVMVFRSGLALLAYAAAGAPAESVAALEQRVNDLVAQLPPALRTSARSALLDVPAQLVFDRMGLRPAHRSNPPGPPPRMSQQWALARGDTGAVRVALTTELAKRGGALAREDSPPDDVYMAARLLLSVGDTAAAERTLDAPLNDLSSLHMAIFRYLPLTGALVRMMALRAELADHRRDARVARHWAAAVIDLWSGAEPGLQDVVTRMRQIARTQ